MKPETIRILADSTLAAFLQARYGGEPLQSDDLHGVEVLLVDAHARCASDHQRGSLGGLKRLQNLLAHASGELPSIVVLGWRTFEELDEYNYLMENPANVTYLQLPHLPKLSSARRLITAASERELELICSVYRHELKALMAAVRIYLGAAMEGAVPEGAIRQTLNCFEELAQKRDHSILKLHEDLVGRLLEHRRIAVGGERGSIPAELVVWMLDDQFEDNGWRLLLESLLDPSRVLGFSSWEPLQARLAEPGACPPDVLLLDCNLGSGGNIPTGLERLHQLRSAYPDLHIVFMTAYDDAPLALTSLREGANAFFAKQLHDVHNRSSVDYYRQFVLRIVPHPLRSIVNSYWRTCQNRIGPEGLCLADGRLTTPPERHAVQLSLALLFSFLDDNLDSWQGMNEPWILKAAISVLRSAFPKYAARMGEGTELRWFSAAHGAINEPLWDARTTSLVWKALFGEPSSDPTVFPRSSMANLRPPETWWPYSPEQLQQDSAYPGISPQARPLLPDRAESQGAVELLRGTLCRSSCRHAKGSVADILRAHPGTPSFSAKRVAFVDDQASSNGWGDAMKRLIPNVAVFGNVDDLLCTDESYNLIIFDLTLPNETPGQDAFRRLHALRPGVPILALGRIDDSLSAIRVMRCGAADFVARSLTCQRNLDACFFFADELRVKVCLLAKLGADELAKNRRRHLLLRRDSRWKSDERRSEYDRAVRGIAAHAPKSPRFFVPPTSSAIEAALDLYLALLLECWYRAFELSHVSQVPPERDRIRESRDYRLRPLDDWLFAQLFGSALDASIFLRVSAVLAGNCAEFLAMSRWCLDNCQPLELRKWGSPELEISGLVKGLRAEFAWHRRNDATNNLPFAWTLEVMPRLLNCVFGTIHAFGESCGWVSGAGA